MMRELFYLKNFIHFPVKSYFITKILFIKTLIKESKFSLYKFVFLLFMIYYLIIITACEKHEVESKDAIKKSSGTQIFKNTMDPLFPDFKIAIEEDLEIKESSTDLHYMFYQVTDIGIDSEENIYILDSGNKRIQKYDKNGQYILTIGKEGIGPGEFQSPTKLLIDKNDFIYVKNERQIDKFNNKGNYIKSFPFNHKTIDFFIPGNQNFNFIVTPQETIFANIIEYAESGGFNSLVKLNSNGEIVKEIDKLIDHNIKFKGTAGGGVLGGTINPYNPKVIFSAFKDGQLIYGHSHEYILFILDKNDKVISKIIKDETPIPISRQKKLKNIYMPKTIPFFSKILIDNEERIWISKINSNLNAGKEIIIDIFRSDGQYLYQVFIPYYPEIIMNRNIYSLVFSENTGELTIKKLKIINWDKMKF